MEIKVKINEFFTSIQGESTYSGLLCTFIRFTGCNLRCSYCDTRYAYQRGRRYSIDQLIDKVKTANVRLVEITGGEPLLQKGVYPLSESLINEGYDVLMETNGSISVKKLDQRVIKIVDLKCPGSGMSEKMEFKNLFLLENKDQVKFVIGDETDYRWTKEVIERYSLINKVQVLLSPVTGKVEPKDLVGWILEDKLPVRFQLPIHKYVWGTEVTGK